MISMIYYPFSFSGNCRYGELIFAGVVVSGNCYFRGIFRGSLLAGSCRGTDVKAEIIAYQEAWKSPKSKLVIVSRKTNEFVNLQI